MMEKMQAEAERRAETMLQKLTRMLKIAPKNDIGRAAPISESEPTSGRSTRMSDSQGQSQATRAAQPSWTAVASTGAQKMTGWTIVTNGRRKRRNTLWDRFAETGENGRGNYGRQVQYRLLGDTEPEKPWRLDQVGMTGRTAGTTLRQRLDARP